MNFSGSKTIATMKNLFKSLMLVAVAAIAFTACTTEQIEINAVAKKTIIKMSASLNDDTRSGFLTPEEGSVVYKSEWHEDDQIIVAETGNCSNNTTVAIATNGDFTAVLDGEVGFIDVYSPASAWTLNETYAEATLPKEQTPLANSVDPKAHILKCSAAPVSGGSVKLSHEFAYGKMSVATPEGFVIDRVEVLFEGSFSGTAREQELTLYADNVENNEFWFATQYMTVETFTVTAYDADDKAYTKTVNVSESENTLEFAYNTLKSFGVANLTEVTDEPEELDNVMDSASYYYNYNNLGVWDKWGYLVFEDEYLGTAIINLYTANENYIALGTHRSWTNNYVLYRIDGDNSFYKNKLLSPYVDNTMIVDVVDGKYNIQLSLTNEDEETLTATYVGDINGIGYPEITEEPEEPEQPGGGEEPEQPEQPGGGDEPVQPENPSNADGKTLETAYTFTTYTKQDDWGYPVMCLSGSEDNAVFEFESNSQSGYPTGLQAFNSGNWYPNWLKYEVNGTVIHSTVGSEQPSAINLAKSYTWLEKDGSGYTVEYIMIVLDNGDTVWYKFNGSFAF